MSAYMRKHTSNRPILFRTSIHNQQRKLSEYTSFIYFHSQCIPYMLIRSFFLSSSPFASYPFDDSFPSWLLLLLFISSLPFIIGEPESTMINEVLRAVCKLCMFQMIQCKLKGEMLFNGWLAQCLKDDGLHTNIQTHTSTWSEAQKKPQNKSRFTSNITQVAL